MVSNAEMGDLFEELIRKFAEASNETAGEHFTPRDAIRLMVDLLFAEDSDALTEKGVVRSIYDPTAGTGGMLSVAEEHLKTRNPDARLGLYGQEINDQSYAICKSDMIAKGQDAGNIQLGDTLADDLFAGRTFDFCLSNPPYGVDWKASEEQPSRPSTTAAGDARPVPRRLPADQRRADAVPAAPGHQDAPRRRGRRPGRDRPQRLPAVHRWRRVRASEIRRWLLENDLVDAIVALPTNMFYNTGIATYIWILDNTKQPERVGKVQLIDGTDLYAKMRKNLGAKNRELADEHRETILRLYDEMRRRRPVQDPRQRPLRLLDHHRRTTAAPQLRLHARTHRTRPRRQAAQGRRPRATP